MMDCDQVKHPDMDSTNADLGDVISQQFPVYIGRCSTSVWMHTKGAEENVASSNTVQTWPYISPHV